MINTSLFALFGRYKGDASLAGVLENIQRGTYKQFIDETREALASDDKELAAKLKKKLPAFTPQATYSGNASTLTSPVTTNWWYSTSTT